MEQSTEQLTQKAESLQKELDILDSEISQHEADIAQIENEQLKLERMGIGNRRHGAAQDIQEKRLAKKKKKLEKKKKLRPQIESELFAAQQDVGNSKKAKDGPLILAQHEACQKIFAEFEQAVNKVIGMNTSYLRMLLGWLAENTQNETDISALLDGELAGPDLESSKQRLAGIILASRKADNGFREKLAALDKKFDELFRQTESLQFWERHHSKRQSFYTRPEPEKRGLTFAQHEEALLCQEEATARAKQRERQQKSSGNGKIQVPRKCVVCGSLDTVPDFYNRKGSIMDSTNLRPIYFSVCPKHAGDNESIEAAIAEKGLLDSQPFYSSEITLRDISQVEGATY